MAVGDHSPTRPGYVEPGISKRIALLRFAMIFGIVILHTPPYIPLEQTGAGLFDFIKAFCQHALFRSTVPVLTCVSGYLLFNAGLDQKIRVLVTKKTRTLLIPLIVWNLPLVLALYVIQSKGLMTHDFSATLYPFDPLKMIDKTLGLFSLPVNYPLNFLRDLFILCLMAPLFGPLLRHAPWVGLAGVFVLFWFNFDGPLIIRSTMPIHFYLAGMAALQRWDLTRLDRFAPICLVLLVTICAAIVQFEITDRNWFRLISPLLIWPLSSLFLGTAVGRLCIRLSPTSFFLFLSHGPVLLAVWILYQKLLAGVHYHVFWFVAPYLVAALCLGARKITASYAPTVYRFALGSR